jgi:sugar phosphate isomerase/epimerase
MAEDNELILAIENHLDMLADELLEIVTDIDSASLGVCLDTANNLRLFEDPVVVATKLAPFVRASHIKDIAARRGDPKSFAFWPSVPLGQGLVDIPAILKVLNAHQFEGLLAFEIDFLPDEFGAEEEVVARSIAVLRDMIAREVG